MTLVHTPLLEPTKTFTMKPKEDEIVDNLKPSKNKLPSLMDSKSLNALIPSSNDICILEGQKAEVFLALVNAYNQWDLGAKDMQNEKPMADQEGEWLQIAAANYGLSNLLSAGMIPIHASLIASQGLSSLLEMRSSKCKCTGSENGNTVFDSEVPTKKASKRKKSMNDDRVIELDLGKRGPLKAKVARKSSEDIAIAFATANVKAFMLYMSEIGADC